MLSLNMKEPHCNRGLDLEIFRRIKSAEGAGNSTGKIILLASFFVLLSVRPLCCLQFAY